MQRCVQCGVVCMGVLCALCRVVEDEAARQLSPRTKVAAREER